MTDLAAQAILARAGNEARTFARNDLASSPTLERFLGGLSEVMSGAGYERLAAAGADANVVLHVIDAGAPRPYRRKAAPTFVPKLFFA